MWPVSENEFFVALIRVADEDPVVRSKLLEILSHPPLHRGAVLRFYIQEMSRKKAPEHFVSALACLLEDEVADRALSFLRSSKDGDAPGKIKGHPPKR
jgi:hypothetical protein